MGDERQYQSAKQGGSLTQQASARSACSSSKKRKAMKDQILQLVMIHPGYTATQVSWINAGFWVDGEGVCQPVDVFAKCQLYFSGKRRASEISQVRGKFDDDGNILPGKHKPLVRIGPARMNPHDEAVGLYPIGMSIGELKHISTIKPVVLSGDDPPDVVEIDKPDDEFAGIKGIGDVLDLLNDD